MCKHKCSLTQLLAQLETHCLHVHFLQHDDDGDYSPDLNTKYFLKADYLWP